MKLKNAQISFLYSLLLHYKSTWENYVSGYQWLQGELSISLTLIHILSVFCSVFQVKYNVVRIDNKKAHFSISLSITFEIIFVYYRKNIVKNITKMQEVWSKRIKKVLLESQRVHCPGREHPLESIGNIHQIP